MIGRREFITLLGGAAAALPLAARAQQSQQMRRIGVLMGWNETDREAQSNLAAFVQELQQLGWTDGRNMRIDYRWSNGDVDRMQIFAKELADSAPDAILAHTTPVTAALQQATRTIPIVFVIVSDPVGEGFVAGLSHPGGNITGFIHTEGEFAGKLLELLTEIAPTVKRAAIIFNPNTAPGRGSYYLPSFETAARSFRLQAIAAPVRNDAEIEAIVATLGRTCPAPYCGAEGRLARGKITALLPSVRRPPVAACLFPKTADCRRAASLALAWRPGR